jgi:hypothetical protein
MESTLDILRLTQITKKDEDNFTTKVPSQEDFTMIYQENKVLKARIVAKLSQEQSSEKPSTKESVLEVQRLWQVRFRGCDDSRLEGEERSSRKRLWWRDLPKSATKP